MYWYIARPDELLIDLDRPCDRIQGWTRLEYLFEARLLAALRERKLAVKQVWKAPSISGNLHIAVLLAQEMPALERLVWQTWLGSDLLRGRADLMRLAQQHPYPSLLITTARIPWRPPDAICRCRHKHVTVRSRCRVMARYRGPSPWALFGAPLTRAEWRKMRARLADLEQGG